MRTKPLAAVKFIIGGVVWSIIVLGLLPLCCLSFHSVVIQPAHHHHITSKSSSSSSSLTRTCSTKSSSTDTTDYFSPYNDVGEYNNNDNESSALPVNDNRNSNNGVEIWLDLRGTSLSPSTALELWDLEHDDMQQKANTVPFTKCLVSSSSNNNNNSHNDKQLLQNNNIHVLVDDTASGQSSAAAWGKILPLQTSSKQQQSTPIPILPDPLPAMELISQGKWIVLDTTQDWKKVEEEERLSFLLPLADLISSGAVTGVQGGDNGSGSGSGSGGGIGLTCHTKNEVVKVAMWIQSITNRCNNGSGDGGGKNVRTKTLENGLVIPDNDNDVSMDVQHLQQQFGTTRQARLQYAIVVPYDVGLIKTASMLLLNEGF